MKLSILFYTNEEVVDKQIRATIGPIISSMLIWVIFKLHHQSICHSF